MGEDAVQLHAERTEHAVRCALRRARRVAAHAAVDGRHRARGVRRHAGGGTPHALGVGGRLPRHLLQKATARDLPTHPVDVAGPARRQAHRDRRAKRRGHAAGRTAPHPGPPQYAGVPPDPLRGGQARFEKVN